ncbi:hypothetical protein FHW16_005873, partial [Phyllobacterium myrsinacearum]|nr:hypothetical protein [Phyllobacterium myrsinacearum]
MTAGKQGRRSGSRLDAHEAFIFGLIDVEKDITLNEMVLRLEHRADYVNRWDSQACRTMIQLPRRCIMGACR